MLLILIFGDAVLLDDDEDELLDELDDEEEEEEEEDDDDDDRFPLGDLFSVFIGDNDGGLDFSLSIYPFCLRIFVSGSIVSLSESLRFADVGGDDDSMVEFTGIESIIYKVASFFVAFVISLH